MAEKTDENIDEFMKQLGYVSILFSQVDHLINEANAHLINIDNTKIGYVISNKLHTQGRIDLLKKLITVIDFDEAFKKEVLENVNEFMKLKNQRNEFIHSVWFSYWDHNLDIYQDLYLSKFGSNIFEQSRRIEFSEILGLKDGLQGLVAEFLALLIQLRDKYLKVVDDKKRNSETVSKLLSDPENKPDLD